MAGAGVGTKRAKMGWPKRGPGPGPGISLVPCLFTQLPCCFRGGVSTGSIQSHDIPGNYLRPNQGERSLLYLPRIAGVAIIGSWAKMKNGKSSSPSFFALPLGLLGCHYGQGIDGIGSCSRGGVVESDEGQKRRRAAGHATVCDLGLSGLTWFPLAPQRQRYLHHSLARRGVSRRDRRQAARSRTREEGAKSSSCSGSPNAAPAHPTSQPVHAPAMHGMMMIGGHGTARARWASQDGTSVPRPQMTTALSAHGTWTHTARRANQVRQAGR